MLFASLMAGRGVRLQGVAQLRREKAEAVDDTEYARRRRESSTPPLKIAAGVERLGRGEGRRYCRARGDRCVNAAPRAARAGAAVATESPAGTTAVGELSARRHDEKCTSTRRKGD